jgi:hypothetical protein
VAQKAQEAAQAGQSKIEGVQTKQADGLLRQLGLAVYAQHQPGGGDQGSAEVDRVLAEISRFEAQNGPIDGHAEPASAAPPVAAVSDDPAGPVETEGGSQGDFVGPTASGADAASSSSESQ